MLFTGDFMEAVGFSRWGLLNNLVTEEELKAATLEVAL